MQVNPTTGLPFEVDRQATTSATVNGAAQVREVQGNPAAGQDRFTAGAGVFLNGGVANTSRTVGDQTQSTGFVPSAGAELRLGRVL